MEVQNLETSWDNFLDIQQRKDYLKKIGNEKNLNEEKFNSFLDNLYLSLESWTQDNVHFNRDLYRLLTEFNIQQSWEEWKKITDGIDAILAQFLIPQNNID